MPRIDKWLWAVRLYKTRTLAANACRQGRVTIAGQSVKPSREVRVDDVVFAQTGSITRTVRVLALLDQRVGAQAVPRFLDDFTPAAELQKPRDPVLKPLFVRPRGKGRPTKKDRRSLARIGRVL